jgi:transposase
MRITTLGVDLAKSVFQRHGVDAEGRVVLRKKLRRTAVLDFLRDLPPCLIGMEACASSHPWARQIAALGHEARLIPPAYVKPYVKRHKNDAADAEAICEAATRPSMRFVPVKSPEQQSVALLHTPVGAGRVGVCGACLGGHEQAHPCLLPHDELA